MRRLIWLLAAGWLVCEGAVPQLPGWKVLFADDFATGDARQWLTEHVPGEGPAWQVARQENNFVYSSQPGGTATLEGSRWYDHRIKVRFRVVRGYLVLNFRARTCCNYLVARGQVRIEPVSPALFTANSDGKGAPAAVALRVAADGAQTQLPVYQSGAAPGSCTAAPIDLGAQSDQVLLLLFGTGIRGGRNVSVRIGGLEAPVLGAAAQGQFVGLDQVNVRLPRALAGRGEVDLVLTVDGKASNIVKLRIQ
jgi:hypothetical protein